jgi:hypothetical protein
MATDTNGGNGDPGGEVRRALAAVELALIDLRRQIAWQDSKLRKLEQRVLPTKKEGEQHDFD